MTLILAQRSTLPGTNARNFLPPPESPAQVVGYFIAGAILLALIFAVVIWIKRRDE